jgi:hypothetical protein
MIDENLHRVREYIVSEGKHLNFEDIQSAVSRLVDKVKEHKDKFAPDQITNESHVAARDRFLPYHITFYVKDSIPFFMSVGTIFGENKEAAVIEWCAYLKKNGEYIKPPNE